MAVCWLLYVNRLVTVIFSYQLPMDKIIPSAFAHTHIFVEDIDSSDKEKQQTIQQKILKALNTTYVTYDKSSPKKNEDLVRLLRSGINGSSVRGVSDYTSVVNMLMTVENWNEVATPNEEISYQGNLTKEYKGLAAYATLEEVHGLYGTAGLTHIHFGEGGREEDPFYAYTPLPIQTDIITVQLIPSSSTAPFKQWFAGKDIFSILQFGIKDTIIRCNWRPRTLKHY